MCCFIQRIVDGTGAVQVAQAVWSPASINDFASIHDRAKKINFLPVQKWGQHSFGHLSFLNSGQTMDFRVVLNTQGNAMDAKITGNIAQLTSQ